MAKDFFVPFVVFTSIFAFAFKIILGSPFIKTLGNQCQTVNQYRLDYTGHAGLDAKLCPAIFLFHQVLGSPTPLKFLAYFIGVALPFVILPVVEAYRTKNRLLAYPAIWLLLSQIISLGVTMPIYWLSLILTGLAHPDPVATRNPIAQAHIEAIIFGVIVGAVIPSVGLIILDDPYVTAIWQAYPIFILIAEFLHLLIRPISRFSESGYKALQVFYVAAFVVSSSIHISIIWPMIHDLGSLKHLLLPSTVSYHQVGDIATQSFEFLKWDMTFSFLSMMVGTFWYAANTKELFQIVIWYLFAVPLFGPGAAVMAVALWRESVLSHRS